MIGKNTTTILYVLLAVILTLQVKSCFFDKDHKPEQMIRNEERLKYLEEKRLADSVVIVETRGKYDSLIALSDERLGQLLSKFQQTKIIYEKIPVIISNYDREQLRTAITEY